jgi:hypothetical protein
MKLLCRFENTVLAEKKIVDTILVEKGVDTILIKQVVYSILVKERLWILKKLWVLS